MKKLSATSIIIVAALLAFHTPSYSQNASIDKKDSLIFYTRSEVDHAIKSNLDKALKANANSAVALLGMSNEKAPYLVVARTKPGLVEIHEQWDDIAIIRSGSGILKTGHQVTGEKKVTNEEPDREWRGGIIKDGDERNLTPGDFIVIPAMLAHQYVPKSGDTLTYWTIKVKRTRNDGEKSKR